MKPGCSPRRRVSIDTPVLMDVPVQYFQSVIAIELAVTGALLWQIHYFDSGDDARPASERLPDSRLRLGLALVLGATLFGSLWAMVDEGPKWAAIAVTIGLAISLVPLLLRVLPPLAKDAKTSERDPDYAVTSSTSPSLPASSSCSTSIRRTPSTCDETVHPGTANSIVRASANACLRNSAISLHGCSFARSERDAHGAGVAAWR